MDIKKGRCLCGQTRYEYNGDELWCGYCHCESCRRNTASPVAVFIGVPRTAYQFTGVQPGVYESSSGVRRHFCKNCGTPMAFDADKYPDEIHFYLVSLENQKGLKPEIHFHHDEHLPWMVIDDNLPKESSGLG